MRESNMYVTFIATMKRAKLLGLAGEERSFNLCPAKSPSALSLLLSRRQATPLESTLSIANARARTSRGPYCLPFSLSNKLVHPCTHSLYSIFIHIILIFVTIVS